MALIISVSISAGASALAVMPAAAYSKAIDLASTMLPALEAAYAAMFLLPPVLPALDPMATIRPKPHFRMPGRARRAQRKAPVRLTARGRFQRSSEVVS